MKMKMITAALLFQISVVGAAHSQIWDRLTNPTVSVRLTHPPGLGLKIDKVAFGPASGECADQIVDALVSDFVSNNIQVVDRDHLQELLSEHDFTLSGYVDQTSAAALGKILGPSALIFVKTQRCATQVDKLQERATRYDPKTKTSYPVTIYYSRTRAFLKASIQTVDLATGRIFAARTLDYSPEQKNRSEEGYPEAPAEFDVLDKALRSAIVETHRMFLSWSEPTELVFYNDKDCGLKLASDQLKAGDFTGAFDTSMRNLDSCKALPEVKDKVLGHAYYNVGMGYIFKNEHDKAMEYFREAARLRPGEIVTRAMADCQKAKSLLMEMTQIEETAAISAEKFHDEELKTEQKEAASILTNDDVIKMARMKLSDAIIIQKIKTSKCRFNVSSDALARLNEAGVQESIILKMMESPAPN